MKNYYIPNDPNDKESKYFSHILFMIFTYSFVFISNFLLDIFTSWFGGPSLFGIINLTRKWGLIIGTVLELGLVSTLPKFIAEKRSGNYLKLSVILLFSESIVALSLGVILFFYVPYSIMITIEFGFIASSSIVCHGILYSIARGSEKLMKMFYLQFSLYFIRFLTFVLLIYFNIDLFITIFLSFSIFPIISIIIMVPFFKIKQNNNSISGNFTEKLNFSYLFKFSTPIYISSIIAIIAVQLDAIVVGFFFSQYILGLYLVAISIVGLLNIVNNSLNVLILPKISKNSNNQSMVNFYISRSIKFFLLIYLPTLFTLFFYPEIIINFLYGPGYSYITFNSIRILIISAFFNQISAILIEGMIGLGKPSSRLFGYSILFISKLCFFLIFVPFIGIFGVSTAVFLSEIIQFIFLFLFFKNLIKSKYNIKSFHLNLSELKFWVSIFVIFFIIYFPSIFILNYTLKMIYMAFGLIFILFSYIISGKLSFIFDTLKIPKTHLVNNNTRSKIISNRILKITSKLSKKIKLILDDGCGDGSIDYNLSDNFCIIGIEPNFNKLRKNYYDKKLYRKINYIISTGEFLPFKNEKFDFIISHMVLEHCISVNNYLYETCRVIKKSSFIYIAAPNRIFPIEPHSKLPFISLLKSSFHPSIRNLVNHEFNYITIVNTLKKFVSSQFDITPFILKFNLYKLIPFISRFINKNFRLIYSFYFIIKYFVPSWIFLLKKN
ncbi:MAG: oligosaccharide flippase family protein [Candidatus Helarchaeota archaeon]